MRLGLMAVAYLAYIVNLRGGGGGASDLDEQGGCVGVDGGKGCLLLVRGGGQSAPFPPPPPPVGTLVANGDIRDIYIDRDKVDYTDIRYSSS